MKPLRRSLDELEADIRAWAQLTPDEYLPLIRIARTAVAFRDCPVGDGKWHDAAGEFFNALRDAGL